MRNITLEKTILKVLRRVETGLKEKTLQSEVEIAIDRPTLTSDEFLDALIELEDRGLVESGENFLGEKVWQITVEGELAI